MFTGYQARIALVHAALERTGHSVQHYGETLASWKPADLHLLVAHFLHIRFPILLALNKSDLPPAAAHIQRLRNELPHEPSVPVSAQLEWKLCQWRRRGLIEYIDGASTCAVAEGSGAFAALPAAEQQKLRAGVATANSTLGRLGDSGVLAAMNAAVALRDPLVVYPVADLSSCSSYAQSGGGGSAVGRAGREAAGVLRDALLMRPGSTVEDLYTALKRAPLNLVTGDFVRAEARGVGVIRKTQPLSPAAIVHVQTNKKC
eukprot:m.305526 g.305526  ORF g.305526 m.305526 type:complete len:260 (-) comp17941_c0_seq1:1110-1889(-)